MSEQTRSTEDGMESELEKLSNFLDRAVHETYAGNGGKVHSQRPGFIELGYSEGEFEYRDSYTGFFSSAGQEIVRSGGKPLWYRCYGGGMTEEHHGNTDFAQQTFGFLKKALGKKEHSFQPRGPRKFTEDEWVYHSNWEGTLEAFRGHEAILYKEKTVFTQEFFGGLFIHEYTQLSF